MTYALVYLVVYDGFARELSLDGHLPPRTFRARIGSFILILKLKSFIQIEIDSSNTRRRGMQNLVRIDKICMDLLGEKDFRSRIGSLMRIEIFDIS